MPEIDEIKSTVSDYKGLTSKYIWAACPDCGAKRWVGLRRGKPRSKVCSKCLPQYRRGQNNSSWRGGRTLQRGYVLLKLQPDDFFYPMADHQGYVREHRLVVAKALGRCLHLWEIVHHKKGYAKDDNRYPETLQLVTDDRHKQITILETRIARLENKLEEQGKFAKLLLWQIKELNSVKEVKK